MKWKSTLLLLCGLLGGCASSPNDYLKQINITLPLDHYRDVSDQLEAGREVATPFSGPSADDYPPSRVILMKDPRPYPSLSEPKYAFPAQNAVRFYDLASIGKDRTIQYSVERLRTVMRERPPSSAFRSSDKQLPHYPTQNAGLLVHHKVSYHDYQWGSGVFYLAQFTQGPGNVPNNEELAYQFQGLSKDGRMYVSAAFRVTHPILPATMNATLPTDDIDGYAEKLADSLDLQTDASFSPDLAVIRSWIESIKVSD